MRTPASGRSRGLGLTAAIAMVAAFVVPSAGGIATAQEFGDFSISPTSGPGGTLITVGEDDCGWWDRDEVTIYWPVENPIGEVQVNSDGCLEGSVTVPDDPAGTYEVTAGGGTGPSTTFTIEDTSEPEPDPGDDGLRTAQLQAIDRMRQDAVSEEVSVDWDGGLPIGVDGRWAFDDTDIVHSAMTFLADHATGFLLDNPAQGLFLEGVTTSPEQVRHLRFGQHVAGVPVYGAQLLVAVDGTDVVGVSGVTLPVTDVQGNVREEVRRLGTESSREGLLDPDAAADAAVAAAPADDARLPGEPQRVIFDAGLNDVEVDAQTPTHAWRALVHAGDGSGLWEVVVDGRDGDALSVLSMTASHEDRKWKIFDANGGHGWNMYCTGINTRRDRWFDEDGVWRNASPDQTGWDAFNMLDDTVDYLHAEFGAHSHAGTDPHKEKVFVHSGTANALNMWGCHTMTFSNGYVEPDVMGHEFTHGLLWHWAKLRYRDQPGALHESFADVIGEIVEFGPTQPVNSTSINNWLHGRNTPNGPSRSLANPPAGGQPDHMDSAVDGNGTGFQNCPRSDDDGCVHTNSGIPNKVGFLLLQPTSATNSHHGYDVSGIGVERAEELYWNVMQHRLDKKAQFHDAAREMTELADKWARSGTHGFTDLHECSVRNAWASVGLREGAADIDCDGRLDRVDPDDDNDGHDDVDDNCPMQANPSQVDTDGDGTGDACDGDRDGDGVANGNDNCPSVANPDQENRYGGPAGDACEDGDGDGIADGNDNCRTDPNPDQSDVDGDGAGDACDGDIDGDGVANGSDNCPGLANAGQADRNANGTGDACDDPDFDDVYDADDNCPDVWNPDQVNTDGADDGGDRCDTDDDNDGVEDFDDNCEDTPNADQSDRDGDGTGDACDVCPDTADDGTDTDGDGAGDACDPDDDGDGVPDDQDNCPKDHNPRQHDPNQNGDGLPCDAEDQQILSDADDLRRNLHASLSGDFGDPEAGVELPLELCNPTWCDEQPWVDPERTTTRVEVVTTDPDLRARIVREDGTGVVDTHVADREDGTVTKVAEFTQDADTRFSTPEDVPGVDEEGGFSPQSADTEQRAQQDGSSTDYTGMGYELQLYPSPDTANEDLTVQVSVSSEQRPLAETLPSRACPPGDFPTADFTDVPADGVHADSIDCIAWWEVTRGVTEDEYAPLRPVTRGQMASFLARGLAAAGVDLPSDPPDAFDDDDGSVHEPAINQLASLGVTKGVEEGRYAPMAVVPRDQMATFLVRTHEEATGQSLPAGRDRFEDDDGTFHEDDINRAAAAGFTRGQTEDTYAPDLQVRRAPMATFLNRMLDSLADAGHVDPWLRDAGG